MTEILPAHDLAGRIKRSKSEVAHETFALHCRAAGLPQHAIEHRFMAPERQWRFDFAWPVERVAVEIEGIVFRKVSGRVMAMGRHAHPEGFREDCRKYASANILGWHVLRFDPEMVKSGEAVRAVIRMMSAKGWVQPPQQPAPVNGADPF